MEEYKYSDLTQKIIGCAMKVHGFLGNGFQEVIYQRALALELKKLRLILNGKRNRRSITGNMMTL